MNDIAQAKMFVRSLNNSTAKILVAFILARCALDVHELREWTGMKRETIYDGLNTLSDCCMVEKQVLAHGRTVWLPAKDALPGFFQMSVLGTPELQMSRIRTSALEEEESSINLIKLNTNSSTIDQMSVLGTSDPLEGKFVYPSVKEILGATSLLFGQPGVVTSGLNLDVLMPWTVLGWIGWGWDQWREGGRNGNLFAPAGLIYTKLADPNQPHASRGFHEGGWNILPADFLEALRLIEYECEICRQKFAKRADLDSHAKEHPVFAICEICRQKFLDVDALDRHVDEAHAPKEQEIVPDESVKTPIHGILTAERAWESVLGQLEMGMPHTSFETWVRDTKAVRYGGNALQIGVRNAYARDWLESRLRSTAERLLVGILAQSVSVEFVVAEVSTEGES